MKAAKSDNAEVRVAAVKALASLGNASTAETLARFAAKAEDAERDAARSSLDRLRGKDVDPRLLQALGKAKDEQNMNLGLEVIRSLGQRNAKSAVPTLLGAAGAAPPEIRKESLKTLALLAGKPELPKLLEILVGTDAGDLRKEAENTVVAAARRIEDENKRVGAALAVYANATDAGVRASLLRVAGRIGDNSALDALRAASTDSAANVRDAAVRALAAWPNAAPIEALAKIAGAAKKPTHQVLALQGYLRLVLLPSKREPAETLGLLQKGMALAQRPEEEKLVLNGLGRVPTLDALKFARKHFAKSAVRAEAIQAALTIANTTKKTAPEETKAALAKALASTSDEALRKKVQAALDSIEKK